MVKTKIQSFVHSLTHSAIHSRRINMAEAGPPAGVQVVIEDDRVIDTEAALNACGQEWSFMLELLGYALEEKEDNILKLRQCLQRKWRMTVRCPPPPLSSVLAFHSPFRLTSNRRTMDPGPRLCVSANAGVSDSVPCDEGRLLESPPPSPANPHEDYGGLWQSLGSFGGRGESSPFCL